MYDYGISGLLPKGMDKKLFLNPDTELFLQGIQSLKLYFSEDDVPMPMLSLRAVQTALARYVLEGGCRYTDDVSTDGIGDYLTLMEIALLADMDERSVRNAANPKLPGALKTETIGKRSVVSIEEAERWLAGRKGFVPTQKPESQEQVKTTEILLPASTAELLQTNAQKAGLSVAEFIEQRLSQR